MFFLLNHYDSFVYNLSACIQAAGQDIIVKRPHEIGIAEIDAMEPEGIILSPGPGHPSEYRFSGQIIERYKGKVPILGVCLGHQIIGHYFGAQITKGVYPIHGKLSDIFLECHPIFDGLPRSYGVTRYHSLVISRDSLPEELVVTAETAAGEIMGIAHRDLPVYGVQFHPEAVLTQYGHELLRNFIRLCGAWRCGYEKN